MTRPSTINVRLATPDDEAAISGILQDSYPALMAPFYDPALLAKVLPVIVHAKPALLATGRYYMAVAADGQAVGCGGWTHEAPGAGDVQTGLGHLRHFGTRIAWGGQGIGRSIYECCAQQARREGVTAFMCYANLNAVGFYDALGFRPVAEKLIPMGKDASLTAMVMTRELS
jgi:N-acetylglutamate synthase-like GNAT family acetyltransferase